jgi:hypothetical protein
MANPIICTEEQTARLLLLTVRKLRKLRRLKKVPCIRIDRYTTLYNPKQVARALAALGK